MTLDLQKHRAEVHGIGRLQENLRQIVYGGNDGIVTTFAVVAGFAGAQAEGVLQIGTVAVLLFGFANLLADGVSMGLGEFLSARSQHDVYHAIRHQELRAIAKRPKAEADEVLAILAHRGVNTEDATAFVAVLERNPEMMADFMMSYEFGMSDPDEENPAINGLFTFFSFLVFGVIPILPYVFLEATQTTFLISVLSTFGALFSLGLLRWFATLERLVTCLAETVLVGGICASVAYGVGLLFGG
ncbi:MAG: VIT1/CCC1 transporter family protein [Proteobacteria bacterium]|nr:VIT1/CCC1 transporter family protein [Pseudomonadota bacterium]MDA1286592.1 VIT1/CCC1 transporter family protein [Pseudomonadota bacterium]